MGQGRRIIALDFSFMALNFSALTLFSVLKDFITSDLGMTQTGLLWAAEAYSIGIFAAFLIGHSPFMARRPRLTVLLAGLLASVPQFLIPVARETIAVIVLRFIQGLVMAAIPIFTFQGGTIFPRSRTLAVGLIISGIFVGGLVGSLFGPPLSRDLGWRGTYWIFGVLMLSSAIAWFLGTPKGSLPSYRAGARAAWRDRFTVAWGFTFFPGIWVVFSLAPIINFLAEQELGSHGGAFSSLLEALYIVWSIASGILALRLGRTFRRVAGLQTSFYAIAAAGSVVALASTSPASLVLALVLVSAIQGTGPTFWSVQTLAYDLDVAASAGYALGLISNSGALVGPPTTVLVGAGRGSWFLILLLAVSGAALTAASSRLRTPRERGGA